MNFAKRGAGLPASASGRGGGQGPPAVTRTRNLSFPKREFFALVGLLCSALKLPLKPGAHFCEICGMGTDATPPLGGPQIGLTGQTGGESAGTSWGAFGRWPCVFLSAESGSRGEQVGGGVFSLFPCVLFVRSCWRGALHLMEGRKVQHEVSVAGLAVAALAVPVFDLDESPPLQLIERAARCVFRTAAAVCGGPRKAVLCFVGEGGARERTQFSPIGGNGVERTLRQRWPAVFLLT